MGLNLTDFHKSVQEQLKLLGYFYEIQAGSFDSQSKSEKANYKGDSVYNQYLPSNHDGKIASKDAIQCFVAGIKQNPTDAYNSLSEFMPNGNKYETVFTDTLTSDWRLLLYPYLVKEYARTNLGYGKGGDEKKRNATLFFVAIYFSLSSKILEYVGDMININLQMLERIFQEITLNKELLKFADSICISFLDDDKIILKTQEVGSFSNFFKHYAYSEEFNGVVQRKIDFVERLRLSELKKKINAFIGQMPPT